MSDHRYRFRLPDGQVFEAVGLAKIKRQYPDAYIEGRVEFNARGEGTLVPYHGEQPEDPVPADEPAEELVIAEEPAASVRRRRG